MGNAGGNHLIERIHDLVDQQNIQQPEALALTDTLGETWTYSDLCNSSIALAKELTNIGVQKGDRVLIVLENCASVVAAIFAISRIGATSVPFNARQTQTEVDRVVDHAQPAAILFTSAVSLEAAAHAKRLESKHGGAEPIKSLKGLDCIFTASTPEGVLHDVSTILYTTGTTGIPKGVMLTHANLYFGGFATYSTRDVCANDTLYGVLPISHVFGLTSILMASVIGGANFRLEPRFNPANLYQALNSGVTLLSAVPQMHALLMQYTKEQGHEQLSSKTLRYVSSGAAPLDSQDAQDDVGEIMVGGGGVMKGYFRNAEESAKALTADGWLRTGDLGRYDDAGNLHIAGRSKELIIHSGFNVYPPEVEAAFNDHPQVVQCAVIGHMVEGNELVYAFIEAARSDWPDEDDLRRFVAERLTGYKRPSRIITVDKLPAAPTGKIIKSKLKDLLE